MTLGARRVPGTGACDGQADHDGGSVNGEYGGAVRRNRGMSLRGGSFPPHGRSPPTGRLSLRLKSRRKGFPRMEVLLLMEGLHRVEGFHHHQSRKGGKTSPERKSSFLWKVSSRWKASTATSLPPHGRSPPGGRQESIGGSFSSMKDQLVITITKSS